MGSGPHCAGCKLETLGKGFVPVDWNADNFSGLMLIGEAAGDQEAREGKPFVSWGQSGSLLADAMREMNIRRSEVAIANIISCHPPKDWLVGAPWEFPAIGQCTSTHLSEFISSVRPKAILTLGGTAFGQLTNRPKGKYGVLDYLRGFVLPGTGAANGIPVIGTYHPAFARRGKPELGHLIQRDLRRAFLVARGKLIEGTHYSFDPHSLGLKYQMRATLDEAWKWYHSVDPVLPIFFDIETPRSAREDEDERTSSSNRDINLTQFTQRPGEGIALPFRDEYRDVSRAIMALPNLKVGHNNLIFDCEVMGHNGFTINGEVDDTMVMWGRFQPDLPANLQAVAGYFGFPFNWKHLADSEQEFYGICDVDALARIYYPLRAAMEREDLWLPYARYFRRFWTILRDMAHRGLPISESDRIALGKKVESDTIEKKIEIQSIVPEEVLSVKQKNGYKNPPILKCEECGYAGREDHQCTVEISEETDSESSSSGDDAVLQGSERTVTYAELAEENGIVLREITIEKEEKCRCTKKTRPSCDVCLGMGVIPAGLVEMRWAALTEFNPNSSHQVKRYIKFRKHPLPKHAKRTDAATGEAAETTEVKELERLFAKTKDPIYPKLIELRQLSKIHGTYVEGWKPGTDGRIHTTFTYRPATWQTSSKAPNCFSADTEILTMRGWVLFPEIASNDAFAQYDSTTGEIDFTWATAQHKHEFDGHLHHIRSDEQIDLLMTADHRCLLQTRRTEKFDFYPASEYPPDKYQIQAGQYVGGHIDWRESQIVLICALQADGHVLKPSKKNVGGQYVFSFKKPRKIARFRQALIDEGIKFTERYKKDRDQQAFYIGRYAIPDWWRDKKLFGMWIVQLSREALDYFSEEVWFWDGCASRRSMYASKQKSNTDWVQIATLLSNRRAKIRAYQPSASARGSAISWQVDAVNKPYSMTTGVVNDRVVYQGYVYCVTMPKGTVIVRRNGRVAITGNCQNGLKRGRTPSQKARVEAFNRMQKAEDGHLLINFDAKSFHAQTTACEAGLADYLRLAKIDIHSFNACHFIKHSERFNVLKMSDSDLKGFFKELKSSKAIWTNGMTFKEIRDGKTKSCIAEGELVLTESRGLVPIQNVMLADRVWDGIEWVNHEGLIYQGEREVMTYAGLTATVDHEVYLEKGGRIPFGKASSSLDRLDHTGFEGNPIRSRSNNQQSSISSERIHASKDAVPNVSKKGRSRLQLSEIGTWEWMPPLWTDEISTSGSAGTSVRCDHFAVFESSESGLSSLRREGDSMQVRLPQWVRAVCGEGVAARFVPWTRDRSDQQRRELRTGESETSNERSESSEPPLYYVGADFAGEGSVDGMGFTLRSAMDGSIIAQGNEWRGDHKLREEESDRSELQIVEKAPRMARIARTYDLLNAGPRHRFTVSGVLVSNCGLGIGFGMRGRKLYQMYQEDFASQKEAEVMWNMIMVELFPGLLKWQEMTKHKAHEEKMLRSRFGAIRRFVDVERFNRSRQQWVGGDQAESAIAFLPAANAFGMIRDMLITLDDAGALEKYQLVNSVHDSLVFHCPKELVEECVDVVMKVMEAPSPVLVYKIAPKGLDVEAEASIGPSLAEMVEYK